MIFNTIILFINIVLVIVASYYTFDSLKYLKLHRYDELIHFLMYYSISLLAFRRFYFKTYLRVFIISFIILLLPIFTEYLQYYTPKRRADISDIFYDYCGLLAGIISILVYNYVKKNKN
tara:strand:+ start:550 stop:906 length:357 start_codon:yes stop_codon:yes gene_type:complete